MTRVAFQLLLIATVACQACAPVRAQSLGVVLRSSVALPAPTTDQNGASFTIAGLSGITYAGASPSPGLHRFIAVMDNSDKLVMIDAAIAADASLSGVQVVGGLTLVQFADFEDIVMGGDGLSVFLSEENTPGVREFSLASGTAGSVLPTPTVFLSRRDNFGFESLAAAGNAMWTANEEALTVDGPGATQATGTLVRLLKFETSDGVPVAEQQYAYRCEPLHGSPVSGARSGLVALVVLPSGRMLAIERSFAFNLGGFFRSRLFELNLAAATDVSLVNALDGAEFSPAAKSLVWSGNLNNLEGLCVGPVLPGGGRILVGIVDDGDPISTNTLVSFHLTGPTEAACIADVDTSGDVGVPDIFLFLAWWFAADVRADMDGNAGVAVPDVFTFLAAWFAGCSL